jgi:ATP-dependent metalloprotease
MDKDVDIEQLARGTPGFTGADLYNLVNQAAIKAAVDNLNKVTMATLEFAKDKIMMGSERKSAVISPQTLKLTAFHEAGHALVAINTDGADPVHKATIMPRGRALGMVMQLPDGDQTSQTRKQMLARIDVCMGGRVAEELVFGYDNVTSGASGDIQQATRMAKAMVTKYGLSDKVGMVFIDENQKQSDLTDATVDSEVREILDASYKRAKAVLTAHRHELDLLAQGLLTYESLAGAEIVEVMKGKKLTAATRSQKPSRPTEKLSNISPPKISTANHAVPKSPSPAAGEASASGSGAGKPHAKA